MRTLILFIALAFTGFAQAKMTVSGFMNNQQVELNIEQQNQMTTFSGQIGLGTTELTVVDKNGQTEYSGLLNGKKIELISITNDNSVNYSGIYNDLKMNMTIEQNNFASKFTGENTNYSLSTMVSKDQYGTTRISGFYQKHLYDLYITQDENGVYFDGYANGYWTNLKIMNANGSYHLIGKFMNSNVDVTITKGHLHLSSILEYLLFGIYSPQRPILLID